MRLSVTGRCLAALMIALQLALFAYVNTALQQCEEQREVGRESAPSFDDLGEKRAPSAPTGDTIAKLRQELEQERRLRVELQAELQQRESPGADRQVRGIEDTNDADDGNDAPKDEAEDAQDLEVISPGAALVFDGGSRRRRGDDHPMRRFHRPLLVRFTNYNTTNPVRTPYGGEAARRWFQRHGYVETDSNDWDVLWCGKGQYLNFASQSLDLPRPWQSHNHCLGAGLLAGNKGSFITHHNIMARQFPQDYTHVPETFDLPLQHASLLARMKEQPDEMYESFYRVSD